jgi:hypothetical protein
MTYLTGRKAISLFCELTKPEGQDLTIADVRISDCGLKSQTATGETTQPLQRLQRLCVKYLDLSRQGAGGAKKSLTPSSNPQSEICTSAMPPAWLLTYPPN